MIYKEDEIYVDGDESGTFFWTCEKDIEVIEIKEESSPSTVYKYYKNYVYICLDGRQASCVRHVPGTHGWSSSRILTDQEKRWFNACLDANKVLDPFITNKIREVW